MACRRIFVVVVLALLFAFTSSLAHHGIDFESDKTIKLQGTVTRTEWKNPHPYIYLDVKTDNGEFQSWAVELTSLSTVTRLGLVSIKVGDKITVVSFPFKTDARFDYLDGNRDLAAIAKDRHFARGAEITLADGRRSVLPEGEKRK